MNAKSVYIGVDPAFRAGGFWACVLDMQDRSVRFIAYPDPAPAIMLGARPGIDDEDIPF